MTSPRRCYRVGAVLSHLSQSSPGLYCYPVVESRSSPLGQQYSLASTASNPTHITPLDSVTETWTTGWEQRGVFFILTTPYINLVGICCWRKRKRGGIFLYLKHPINHQGRPLWLGVCERKITIPTYQGSKTAGVLATGGLVSTVTCLEYNR